jgi:hypothetical protein
MTKVLFTILLTFFVIVPGLFAQTSAREAAPSASPLPAATGGVGIGEAEKTTIESNKSRYVSKTEAARIPRFDSAPIIDGKLNDAIWQTAAIFGDFLQTNPGDNVAPKYLSEAMIGYDSKNLYIAFRAVQDKNQIRATVARRDNTFSDDYFNVYLDTFNDQRQAYVFGFNPLGIQTDGIYTEGRGNDFSVDLVFESKGIINDEGYSIEVAIPFKSLRYEAGKNKLWGILINRAVQYNNGETDSWMPRNRNISGSLNQAGHITGLEGIETTRQLEINPSLTLSESGRRSRYTFDGNPAGRYVNDPIKADLGFTAKFGLTPTITLDFAYNPDFAQVEADAPVVTANQRFPINSPEKRPFFLERIDIFRTRMNVIQTRAIVDPDFAAKITGRKGKNTFGLLYASDNAPGNYSIDEREGLRICQQRRLANPNVVCGIERFVDKNADIAVLRLKRDVGRQHNVGFFATTYNFPDRHNNTYGFDGRFRFDQKTTAEFQLIGTNSRRNFYDPDLNKTLYRTGNGFGYSYLVERAGRNLYMEIDGVGRTRDYRADVGFSPRINTNLHHFSVRYETDRQPKSRIIFKRIFTEAGINHDWLGRTQKWSSNTQGMLALQRQTYIGGGVEIGYERVFEEEFGAKRKPNRPGAFFGADPERSADNREFYAFIETTPNKKIFASATFSYTFGQLDFDLGAGPALRRVSPAALLNPNNPFDPGAGDQLTVQSSFRYQPTRAFQTQLDYTKTRLVRDDTGLTAFDDNIFSSRSIYQFSRNTFARLRLDYSTLSTRLRPQFILGWTPNPGTALYAGYNDDYSRSGYNPFTGAFEPGFRGNGRTFFIKASYLFRKSF